MNDLFIQRIQTLSEELVPIPSGEKPVLKPLPGCKAVIFDVYGTCMISGSGDIGLSAADPKTEALISALEDQGLEVSTAWAAFALKHFYELIQQDHERTRKKGITFPEVRILDIWEQWRKDLDVEVAVPHFAMDVECRLNPVWPMPGLKTTLQELTQAGVKPGIVSNAQIFTPCYFPALTGISLEGYGFEEARCVWSWTGKEAKPSRRLYERVMEGFHELTPEECLYVGNDMRNDIAPASAVGMKTALFAGDKRSLRWRKGDPLVGDTRPDLVLTSLNQLTECIQFR